MQKLAVIIPYYQKERGVLRRALLSILAQHLPEDVMVEVVVVDDGSPLPARAETEGLAFTAPFRLTLIEKENGGVAAARDVGLKHTDERTDYIAFLDSDDSWHPDHLAKAIKSLKKGYNFYFTDHDRVGHHASHFSVISFPPADGKAREVEGSFWEMDKDAFFHFFLRSFTAQISTVVYRRKVHPTASFQSSLRAAGEDRLFMLQVVERSQKIGFMREVCVTCGEGVNIYYSKFGWEDEGHLRRHMADILAAYALKKTLNLSAPDVRFVDGLIAETRKHFAFFTLRWFLKKREKWSKELIALTQNDASFGRWYPFYLLWVSVLYPLRLYRPG